MSDWTEQVSSFLISQLSEDLTKPSSNSIPEIREKDYLIGCLEDESKRKNSKIIDYLNYNTSYHNGNFVSKLF